MVVAHCGRKGCACHFSLGEPCAGALRTASHVKMAAAATHSVSCKDGGGGCAQRVGPAKRLQLPGHYARPAGTPAPFRLIKPRRPRPFRRACIYTQPALSVLWLTSKLSFAFELNDESSNTGQKDPPVRAKSLQSCLTLCNPVVSSQPGCSAHEILQARVLEWAAALLSKLLPTGDQTCVSYIS